MKKNIYLPTLLAMAVLAMNGCEPQGFDAPSGGKVSAVSVKEAAYVSGGTPSMQISLKDNAELQLTVVVLPENAKNATVTFANKHPELLEVTAGGLLKPKGIGTDTLTVSANDGSGVSSRYVVIITDHMVKATGITVGSSGRNMLLRPGDTFDLAAQVTVAPADTWNKAVTYASADDAVATVTAAGVVTAAGIGNTVIRVTTADGSGITTECNVVVEAAQPVDIVRTGWTVIHISHTRPEDTAITNAENSHIDGNAATCLSLVKPGRSYGGVTVGDDEEVSFTIDMGKQEDFDYARILHRNNGQVILRVHGFTLLGSNDNATFTPIVTGAEVPNAANSAIPDSGNIPVPASKYRYVKFVYAAWDNSGGSTMQMAEFYLGIVK